ncbi:unnamed protein product [Ilex paraguariensis]|uniref:Uncharacterized protein n=1 Tax=Ilex paraguariensis TaxID=185542 RepID=A0ABC8SQ35_9AQUA
MSLGERKKNMVRSLVAITMEGVSFWDGRFSGGVLEGWVCKRDEDKYGGARDLRAVIIRPHHQIRPCGSDLEKQPESPSDKCNAIWVCLPTEWAKTTFQMDQENGLRPTEGTRL